MNAGNCRLYGKVKARRRVPGSLLWTALWACTTAGCTLLQPPPTPAPAAPDCSQPLREIARLQQALIGKDAEIGQLRAQQNVQAKELRQTTGEVARAEVKLRRLATQAGAASQLAEAEVVLQSLSKTPPNGATAQRLQAQQLLAAGSAAFAQGDYGAAVEFAAQAQAIVGMVKETQAAPSARARMEVAFPIAVALRTRVASHLRAQPGRSAAIVSVLKPATPVYALGYRGDWLRVRAEDSRVGWVFGALLEAARPAAEK